jgi:hypothetical protein
MKHRALMIIIPLVLVGASPTSSAPRWQHCPGDAGGAFNTRVAGINCGYAARVTEGGITADLRSTRVGHLACTRRRAGSLWSYRCIRPGRRAQLSFNTF